MKIAITGGIGSGKTTLINFLKEKFNIKIISVDNIVHEIIEEPKIKEYLINNYQTTDRKIISNIIFESNDPFKLLYLENIVNEYFYPKLQKIFNENNNLIVEVPLLYEKGLHVLFDNIIVVNANLENRIDRIKKRDPHRTLENIHGILKKQFPQEIKNKLADFIYENNNLEDQNNEELIIFLNKCFY